MLRDRLTALFLPVCRHAEDKLCLLLIFVYFCVHVRSMVLVEGEGQLCRDRFSVHHVDLGDGPQVLRLGRKHLYLRGLLFGLRVVLIISLSSLCKLQKWVARFVIGPKSRAPPGLDFSAHLSALASWLSYV